MESVKPQTLQRRLERGFLPLPGRGIDVGAGSPENLAQWGRWWEMVGMECRPWDAHDGDAHELAGVEPGSYDWLYSSHLLEHLEDPDRALARWVEVVRPGGHLLLSVPHRDLYEGKLEPPSHWNGDHKRFYTPDSFWEWLYAQTKRVAEIALFEVGDRDCVPAEVPHRHATGEYCIDALLVKRG